jgi:hypothetical protein
MSKVKIFFHTILPFLLGAAVVFVYVIEEMRWHWAIGALAAPVGGLVVVLLFRAGAMI